MLKPIVLIIFLAALTSCGSGVPQLSPNDDGDQPIRQGVTIVTNPDESQTVTICCMKPELGEPAPAY